MRPRSLAEIARRIGCEALDDSGVIVTGVTTDSRDVQPGDLFVAVSGETFDGNRFVADAMAAGAIAAVTTDPVATGYPRLVVDDTLVTLRDLKAADQSTVPRADLVARVEEIL